MAVEGDETANIRTRVYMDIAIGGLPSGRLVFELFADVAPKTSENFRALCTGEMGLGKVTEKPLTYKGMLFHRVVKDFMIQGGDFTNANGTGGESIYGGTFEDETFELKHDQPFLLSMANRGKDTNGSQFFITTQPAPHLDNVHVVFGQVVSGMALVKQLEALPVDRNARPLQDVTVTNCGQLVKLKVAAKKQKSKEKESSEASEDERSHKKDKKKKKDKKEKKKKRHHSEPSADEEEGNEPAHPLVMTSKIDPNEIPEVPTNKFLMRGGRDQDKQDTRRERERMRYRDRERNVYTRSGRVIKGRGVFRYRTPSRSRSRSRSVTPPHWRQAQRRIVKLSEIERVEHEREEREDRRGEFERRREKSMEGGTPEPPRGRQEEKEEGECDTTLEGSRQNIDYNALDFEEDIEKEDESEATYKRKRTTEVRGHRVRKANSGEHRADVLARALGVDPDHRQNWEHSRDHESHRRNGPASTVAIPQKVMSTVAQASGGVGLNSAREGRTNKNKEEYDPVGLLRSTFNKKNDRKDHGQSDLKTRDFYGGQYINKGEETTHSKHKNEKDEKDFTLERRIGKLNENNESKDIEKQRRHRSRSRDHRSKGEERDKSKERHKDNDDYKANKIIARNNKHREYRDRNISEKSSEEKKRNITVEDKNENSLEREDKKDKETRHRENRRQKNSRSRDRDYKLESRERYYRRRDSRSRDKSRGRDAGRKSRSRTRERDNKSDRSRERNLNRGERKSRDRSHYRKEAKDTKRSRSNSRGRSDTTKSPEGKQSSSDKRDKSQNKTLDDEEKMKARQELIQIVRMIKEKQKNRELREAESKKRSRSSSSSGSERAASPSRKRSPDRRRRKSSNSPRSRKTPRRSTRSHRDRRSRSTHSARSSTKHYTPRHQPHKHGSVQRKP